MKGVRGPGIEKRRRCGMMYLIWEKNMMGKWKTRKVLPKLLTLMVVTLLA